MNPTGLVWPVKRLLFSIRLTRFSCKVVLL